MFKIRNEVLFPRLMSFGTYVVPPDPVYQTKCTNCYLRCCTCFRCTKLPWSDLIFYHLPIRK